MTANREMHAVYEDLCDELTQRGIDYRKPDVYGFVAGCWPTESSAEQLADDWQTANKPSVEL